MASKGKAYILERKAPIILMCMIGILAVAYGMLKNNNLMFIIGLPFVTGGYLLIRRKIKKTTRSNP
jgi:hypothetical protein